MTDTEKLPWTEGPWWHEECAGEVEGAISYEIGSDAASPIALVEMTMPDFAAFSNDLPRENAIVLANARLIASAPALYEALVAALREMPVTSSAYQDALAALSQANPKENDNGQG